MKRYVRNLCRVIARRCPIVKRGRALQREWMNPSATHRAIDRALSGIDRCERCVLLSGGRTRVLEVWRVRMAAARKRLHAVRLTRDGVIE